MVNFKAFAEGLISNMVTNAIKDYRPSRIEYHARRTEADPKKWRVVEVTVEGRGKMLDMEVKERTNERTNEQQLATDLKRNRAEALVKLLRSNYKES